MSELFRAEASRHRLWLLTLAPLLAVVTLVGLVGCRVGGASSSGGSPIGTTSRHLQMHGRRGVPGELPRIPDGEQRGSLDVADGELPDGVTVFDDRYPAVADLAPSLLQALRQAAAAAAEDGIQIYVDSGWRSRRYQEELFAEAVAKYGSAEQAGRWVAPPGRSAHETGEAVDLGPSEATSWLSEHGASYGLCQIYDNEPWHYELRPAAVGHGCPARYADPTDDPRLQQ
jgi:D-alanyl-D-alanine carboxypeptidase